MKFTRLFSGLIQGFRGESPTPISDELCFANEGSSASGGPGGAGGSTAGGGPAFDFRAMVMRLLNQEATATDQDLANCVEAVMKDNTKYVANEEVQQQVTALQADITRLTGELTTAKAALVEKETAIANEQTRVNELTATAAKVPTLENELGAAKEKITRADERQTKLESDFANERKERVTLLINSSISLGRISLAQKDHWLTRLSKDDAFANEGAAAELVKLPVKYATRSIVDSNRAGDRTDPDTTSRIQRVQELVNEKMESKRLSYDQAYALVQRSEEGKALFANMQQPKDTSGDAHRVQTQSKRK